LRCELSSGEMPIKTVFKQNFLFRRRKK
jgi:hypothetical protein